VPEPIVAALRRAFDETMHDPAYVQKMRAAKVQFNPMSGEDLARNVARIIGAPKSVIDRYKAAASGE
jgi:tripartite-type tricarboxylate transporter receptor subunit TctC